MRTTIGELGLVLLCTSLVLVATTASGQTSDLQAASQVAKAQVPVSKNPTPVVDRAKPLPEKQAFPSAPTAVESPIVQGRAAAALHRATPAASLHPQGERVGGEDCGSATLIGATPYSDTGTTCGYVNDYDEICPYSGSTAPDVAYVYYAASDGTLSITLCVGATNYDSKIYVYQGGCPGPVAGCNDDACSSPAYSNYVSRLPSVPVWAGNTYYLIIDGYGSACGTYYLDFVFMPGGSGSGEDCTGALPIVGLPFSGSGNTCAFMNNYDVVCPYSGSTAPDVVYSLTVGATTAVDITLCIGPTNYDSKIYVYQDTCPGTLVGCNDDACCSPVYSLWVSQLLGVVLNPGHTYYLVIDGYGSACGDYYVDITEGTPPPDCPTDGSTLFGQRPHMPSEAWSAWISAVTTQFTYKVYEDFSNVIGPICDIHWWGLSLLDSAGWYACDPTGMTFTVEFYNDAGGVPGALACSYLVAPLITDTGLSYAGHALYYFEVPQLDPCCLMNAGWVAVQSQLNANDCAFLWMSSPVGDLSSWQDQGGSLVQTGYDRGLCLTGVYIPVFGACCYDPTGACEDNVELINCIGTGQRFAANTLCVNLNPPCGQIPGACCHPDSTCDIVVQWGCADLFLGPYTTCAQCPCVVICPEGATPEPEPCGDDTDDGCNAVPPIFAPIHCGETICGTAWANTSIRDTDWYQLTTTQTTTFTWTAKGEFPILIFIIKGAGPDDCSSYTILYSATAAECTEVSLNSGPQAAGTYWFWVGPSTWADLPCPRDYWARLDCFLATGACCVDQVCVATTTEGDCADLGGIWLATQTCPQFVCPPGCLHRVDLFDCYGDGWNGNTLDVLVNGVPQLVGITMTSGAGPESYYFIADTGDLIQTIYHPIGGWPYEPFYCLYDGMGYPLGCDPPQHCWIGPTGITVVGNCEPATTGACCYYDGSPCQQTPPDGCIDGLFLGLGKPCSWCPCMVPCPPGGTSEPEPCGDDTDGGCNSTPPMFAPIQCGETVCGWAWANTSLRDSDWYQLTTNSATVYEWRVAAEFPMLIFIMKGAGPSDCSSYSILGYTTGLACQEISLNSGPQPAGTYWFWVGPSTWGNFPCPLRYTATLTCTELGGACCLPYAPWCDVLSPPECAAIGGTHLGAFVECNFAQDCNGNGIPDACDLARCDGSPWCSDCDQDCILDVCDIANCGECEWWCQDCDADGIPDECEIWRGARDILQLDDGRSENNWGLTAGGELCWLNHFSAVDPGTLQAIWVCFGSPAYPGTSGVAPGDTVRVYAWSDPDGNGSPIDAVLLDESSGTVEPGAIDSDSPQSVAVVTAPIVGPSFFIGASVVTAAGGYPATADDDGWTGAPDQGFLTFNSVPFDPTQITANLYPMSALGYPQTVFLVRADGDFGAPPQEECDCNWNSIPDKWDIGVEWDGCCTPPNHPGPCSTDWNHNGVPDECEVCGDLDNDSDVDIDDYWIFVGAFGTCAGDPNYIPAADMDGDHCVTLADFRNWRMCYELVPFPVEGFRVLRRGL